LKPHNFGFNENNEIVLFDFGMTISVQSRATYDEVYSMEVKGTFRYMASEVKLGQPYAVERRWTCIAST
jgi:serine/threonine protein kinase